MAQLSRRSEVAAHLHKLNRFNILNLTDATALNEVILDYFTSRDEDDGEDEIIHTMKVS